MLPVPCLRFGTAQDLLAAVGMDHSRVWFLQVQAGSVLLAGTAAVMSSPGGPSSFSSLFVGGSCIYSTSVMLMAADGEVVELLLRDRGTIVAISGRGGGRVVRGALVDCLELLAIGQVLRVAPAVLPLDRSLFLFSTLFRGHPIHACRRPTIPGLGVAELLAAAVFVLPSSPAVALPYLQWTGSCSTWWSVVDLISVKSRALVSYVYHLAIPFDRQKWTEEKFKTVFCIQYYRVEQQLFIVS